MPSKRELIRLSSHLQSPKRETDTDEDVHMALSDLAPRTRAQASAFKKFAVDAGLLAAEGETQPQTASTSTIPSDTESDDDTFNPVPTQKSSWPNVTKQQSLQAWLVWDEEQEDLVRTLESPQYTPRGVAPAYPDLLRNLYSCRDYEDNDASPRTFTPYVVHWQEFDVLLRTLNEFANGRQGGFVKMIIPAEALSTPSGAQETTEEAEMSKEAASRMEVETSTEMGTSKGMQPSKATETSVETETSKELTIWSHRIRVCNIHKHGQFKCAGIYVVKISKNPFEANTQSWRLTFRDQDRVTLRDHGKLPSRREWAQEEMLALPGRHQMMTTSSNNEGKSNPSFPPPTTFTDSPPPATDELRIKLELRDPKLPTLKGNVLSTIRPKTHIHLAAHAGVTRPLRISTLGAYTLHYLHRGGPVTWTIVDPNEYPSVAAFTHCATHAFGASVKRPRRPPQCTASANHHNLYLSHDKLTEWDVGWTAFEQFAGEMVVLGPFAWAQYYWNEAGVMEEAVYGDGNWKSMVARKGFVKQCSKACDGGVDAEGVVDFKAL